MNFFNNLNFNIERVYDVSKSLIIVGDLNEDLLNPNFHNLENFLLLNSPQNTISEPTRMRALLDTIIVPGDFPGTISTLDTIPNHQATFISLRIIFHYQYQKTFKRLVLLYKKANLELLGQFISSQD